MSSEIERVVGDLVTRMGEGSVEGFRTALAAVGRAARAGGPETLTASVEAVAPLLPHLEGAFAKTVVLAGACVEWGGSPMALAPVLPQRAAEALRLWAQVPTVWQTAMPGRPLPEPEHIAPGELVRIFADYGGRHGIPGTRMRRTALSWFDLEDWLKAMITVLAHGDFRAAVPPEDLQQVRIAAAEVADHSQRARWVHDLASVLDDEPLIVLDSATRRGFALTMSGVGDNFQLHTLLADRLIGDPSHGLLPGERPDPAWVHAATCGTPAVGPVNAVVRRFRLFDAQGEYISPEGIPADIPAIEGTHVIVLHPPRGRFSWANGRVYEHLDPTLALDRLLGDQEAARWFARIQPAREHDLMAANPE
ncbi:hypothetical protein ACFXDH_06170 [Streptomyces sp. NPDC059467]|uniref:hypothetical protein n=1 Tax=Streptomyces sp. NPDC059467 TaxID=3346844 RepID=UPI0036BF08B7